MITLHHLENSRSQRILWLLEELGVGYDINHYKRDSKTSLAPPELLAIHPLSKSPVITDGDIKRNLDFIESTLTKSPWFCGKNMTAADVQMSFPLEAAAVRTNLQESYPKSAAFLKRIHALPAYQAALKKGGPYALMG